MAAIDKLKKKPQTQISVALLRMKPMTKEMMMQHKAEMGEDDSMEDEYQYESEDCPKCAEYQKLIGEAIAAYLQDKDSEEAPSPKKG